MQRMIDEKTFEGEKSEVILNEPNSPYSTPIKDFYRGKCVLITGGTGFIGRLLTEKLLRIGVSQIYLVARRKRFKTAMDRIRELTAGPVFDRIRGLDPDFLKRITPVDGDLVERNMGLSEDMQNEFIANVEVILHAAADVRFDETLKNAIKVNIRATRDLLDLAQRMMRLEVIVHVSTAYSNCPLSVIDEKFYEPQCDPRRMIELAERVDRQEFDEDTLITLTPKIIRPWPNTYSFTKALCEDMVKDYGEQLPIIVVRPSIIVGTNEDPFPGWTDNMYGLNGILTACALGLLRTLHLQKEYIGDIVPADFVSNTILAVAWDHVTSRATELDFPTSYSDNSETVAADEDEDDEHASREGDDEEELEDENPFRTKIYNCTSSKDNPITWAMINKDMRRMYEVYPPKRAIWVNCFNFSASSFWFRMQVILYHFLPSLIGDVFLRLGNQKLRLLPIYRKVQGFIVALGFFTTHQWIFHNDNMRKLCAKLTPEDANYFPCDVRRMKWLEYVFVYGKGMRLFLGKESMDTLLDGRRRKIQLQVLHNTLMCTIYAALVTLLYFILRAYHIIDPLLERLGVGAQQQS